MREIETVTASALHERLAGLGDQDAKRAWLDAHELHVAGQWRTFDAADVYRRRSSPLLLYVTFPDGLHEVPMDTEIQVRQRS